MNGSKIWFVLVFLTFVWSKENSDISEETYSFDVSDVSRMDVTISYGLGELNISSSQDENRIEGVIEYDSEYVVPDVNYHSIGSKGKLDINVESPRHRHHEDDEWKFNFGEGLRRDKYEGKVDFQLPPSKSIDIEMDFGLGEADLDFSELSISDLHMDCGLSDVTLSMNSTNPVSCRKLSISSGLGDFNANELGNLKPQEFQLVVGLGSASIDLTGDITEDIEGSIEVGLGSLDLTLPKNVNIKIEVEDTFLSSVDVNGLVKEYDEWVTRKWDKRLPTIELEINVGLGSVDVMVE